MTLIVLSYESENKGEKFTLPIPAKDIDSEFEDTNKDTFIDALLQIMYPENQLPTINPTFSEIMSVVRKKLNQNPDTKL